MIATTAKQTKVYLTKILQNKYFLYIALVAIVFAFLMSNLFFVHQGKYTAQQVLYVLKDPSHNKVAIGQKIYNLTNQDYRNISEGLWAVFATIVAATGLAITGLATQSLTKNPLADASTLGFIQGGIFAILVALSFGWTEYYLKFLAVILGIIFSAFLLMFILIFGKGRMTTSKVILAGLAIGIVFKTFSFLIRSGDKFLSSVSYSYTLGGAEAINTTIGDNQWQVLYISSGVILTATIIFALIAKQLTLLELGDEKARQLGVKIKTTKVITLLVVVACVPAAVVLVGNLAFVGLFAAHISRYFFKTRSYVKLLIPAIFVGVVMSLFGLLLTEFLPKINSGIWMTIIGAPYIIYAGMRGLK